DSVAVNGVCLTATGAKRGAGTEIIKMDVSEETFNKTTLKNLTNGAKVNIEPALTPAKPLGGHLVYGHVDGVGTIESIRRHRLQVEMEISFPSEIGIFIVEKGSIAVDGVSLTVGTLEGNRFTVYLIPYTLQKTTLGERKPGDKVNIEVDMLARYVWKIVSAMGKRETGAGTKRGETLMELLERYEYVNRRDSK
ncbi:MAG: riboflavin synthase, partial [bacterium]